MTTYDFDAQFEAGKGYESRLDAYFSKWYDIIPATRDEQRQGVDRWYIRKDTGRRFAVEYKGDKTASKTGNAFVELTSVDTANKPGWAYTSQSRCLIYLLPDDDMAYVLTFAKLRNQLPRWIEKYPERRIPNKGYCTVGILVPLIEFERHAIWKGVIS